MVLSLGGKVERRKVKGKVWLGGIFERRQRGGGEGRFEVWLVVLMKVCRVEQMLMWECF